MYTTNSNPVLIYKSYDFNQPRVSNLLLKDLISDIEFLKDFEKRPLEILQYYGIDTAEINIPENFKMPPQNVLEKLSKYRGNREG